MRSTGIELFSVLRAGTTKIDRLFHRLHGLWGEDGTDLGCETGGCDAAGGKSLPPRAITTKAKASPADAGLAFFALHLPLRKLAFDGALQHEKSAQLALSAFALVVIRLGFEPKTHSLEGCCSIQLSYRTDPYFFNSP